MPHLSYLFVVFTLPILFGCGAEFDDTSVSLAEKPQNERESQNELEPPNEQEPSNPVDDTLPLGIADDHSALACTQIAGDPIIVTTASTLAEAAQAIIQITEGKIYGLELPQEGSGFITIEIGSWMESVRFFTEHGTTYEILGGSEGFEISNNGSCPEEGLTDHRWFFHEWGSYTVRIDDAQENPVWFMAVSE